MKYLYIPSLALFAALVFPLRTGGIVGNANNAGPKPSLSSSDIAISRAMAYTGFAKTQEFSLSKGNVEAVLTTPGEAAVKLMKDKSAGDSLWQVTLRDVRFTLIDKSRPFREQQHRDFTIWLDAVTGKLIRIHSRLVDTAGSVPRMPFYPELERLLVGNINDIYYGYPDTLPVLTLYDILQTAGSEPFNRKEITAYYVIQSRMGANPRPVWILDIGGVAPMERPNGGGSKTDWDINHMQRTLDPSSGAAFWFMFYTSGGLPVKDTLGGNDQK